MQFVGGTVLGRRRGKDDLFLARAAAQVGMHHAALDRPRPHDRDLDHQIVEFLRLQARQHAHLRPALDLEDADRIGLLQHRVDLAVFLRHGGEVHLPALMNLHQVERLAHAGEHAEPQHVDLHHPHIVDVVLVPFDEVAVFHRRGADRHAFVEPVVGQDEAADMLGEMAREADQLIGASDDARDEKV